MEKIARIGYKLCISICKAIQAKLQYFIIFLQKVIANPILNKRNSKKQVINPKKLIICGNLICNKQLIIQ